MSSSFKLPLCISSVLQDASLDNQTLVSAVLGSSVSNLSISNLTENIEFTIQNSNPVPVSVTCQGPGVDLALWFFGPLSFGVRFLKIVAFGIESLWLYSSGCSLFRPL